MRCLGVPPQAVVFWYAGAIQKRLGVDGCLHVVLACYTLRVLFYAWLHWLGKPWAVLPIQLLHGVTFGLYWSTGSTFARSIAPPALQSTLQGVFNGVNSLGGFLGILIGGFVFEKLGSISLWVRCFPSSDLFPDILPQRLYKADRVVGFVLLIAGRPGSDDVGRADHPAHKRVKSPRPQQRLRQGIIFYGRRRQRIACDEEAAVRQPCSICDSQWRRHWRWRPKRRTTRWGEGGGRNITLVTDTEAGLDWERCRRRASGGRTTAAAAAGGDLLGVVGIIVGDDAPAVRARALWGGASAGRRRRMWCSSSS